MLTQAKAKYDLPEDTKNVRNWDPPTILKDRDFLLLWFSQVTTLIGGGILALSIAFLLNTGQLAEQEFSSSAFAFGMVILLNNLPSFFVSFIAGVMADWLDRKKIMFSINIFRAVVLFIFLIFSGWEHTVFAYSVIFVVSAAKLIFIPSEASSIPDIVSKNNIMNANTVFHLTNQVMYLTGFVIAGPLLNLLGPRLLFSFLIVLFLMAACASYFVRIPKRKSVIRGDLTKFFTLVKDFFFSFLEGFRYILREKVQKVALVHSLMSQAMFYIFLALVFKLGEYLIGLTPTNIGVVSLAPLGVGIVVGMFFLNTRFKNIKRIKLSLTGVAIEMGAFLVATLCSLLIYYDVSIIGNPSYIVSVIMFFDLIIIGFGFPFLFVPSQTLIQERTAKGFLGRVYGVWFALSQAIASIPAVIIGFLADQYLAVPVTLLLYTLIAAIYLGVMWRYRELG